MRVKGISMTRHDDSEVTAAREVFLVFQRGLNANYCCYNCSNLEQSFFTFRYFTY